MLRKNWKIVFLIFLLMLYMVGCEMECYNPTSPDNPVEPKWIEVKAQYQRVDDNAGCPILFSPILYPWKNSVYLAGLKGNKEMQKLTENIHVTVVNDIRVNYPRDKYGGLYYEINVLDNVFYDFYNPTGCDIRAHRLWLNGYLMQKIHRKGNEEYLCVRFDENGVPHEQ